MSPDQQAQLVLRVRQALHPRLLGLRVRLEQAPQDPLGRREQIVISQVLQAQRERVLLALLELHLRLRDLPGLQVAARRVRQVRIL